MGKTIVLAMRWNFSIHVTLAHVAAAGFACEGVPEAISFVDEIYHDYLIVYIHKHIYICIDACGYGSRSIR